MPSAAASSPSFRFTWNPLSRSLIFIIAFVVLGGLVYSNLASGTTSYTTVEWTTVLELLMMVFTLAITASVWTYPIREARFYEDHAELRGKVGSQIYYSQIVQLEQVKGIGILSPTNQVHITLEGQDEPIRIFGNPNSRMLNTNLYAWLWRKTEGQLAKKVYY